MKVQQNLIKPLQEFYGEPNWENDGKNPVKIATHWAEAFGEYHEEVLAECADRIIRSKQRTFPSIGQVFEVLDLFANKPTHEKISMKEVLVDPQFETSYLNYVDWIKKFKAECSCILPASMDQYMEKAVRKFKKRYPQYEKYKWRSVYGIAYEQGWFSGYVTQIREYNDSHKADAFVWAKKIWMSCDGDPSKLKDPFARIALSCMPDEVRRELNA